MLVSQCHEASVGLWVVLQAHPKDLEEDKFEQHKVFVLVMYLAIITYFHGLFGSDVMASASQLFARVQHHGGLKVLYYFMLLHGGPICLWWRATRSNDGAVLDRMWQWYYHMHRASHKTNYACISIIRAINRFCVLRTLRNIKYHRATVSMSGRRGCNCAFDRSTLTRMMKIFV